jgi:hypothetical protein
MEGKVEGGGMKAGAGGKCYHAPTLLGAEEVKLAFWALRWKEKREHSHCDKKRCRRMCEMKINAEGECAELN